MAFINQLSDNYYNEHEPYAAQWLRNLIAGGFIAPGDVDERSIEDVRPDDLKKYTQCHFFAGVGVWSHALRRVGWPDDRPIWTGSCPCQPFSAAGKGAGFADERHLWPAFFHLITHGRPQRVVGEQVAGRDGWSWIDLVQTDLEAANYAPRTVAFPAAGVGAPHRRERLYWVADNASGRRGEERTIRSRPGCGGGAEGDATRFDPGRAHGPLANAPHGNGRGGECRTETGTGPHFGGRVGPSGSGASSRLVDSDQPFPGEEREQRSRQLGGAGGYQGPSGTVRGTGPLAGFWRDADWLLCRDPRGPRWRPVEPFSLPLVNGATARMGRLRSYGNACVPEQAEAFLMALD